MLELYEEVEALARDGYSVLFHGPTGAGKEYVARHYAQCFLEHRSERGSRPFTAVNCSWYSDTNTVITELFGVVPGFFPHALTRGKPGLFEECERGILFLDEVGDLPEETQPRLLRAFSPGEGRRLGAPADCTYSTENVLILSATDQPLSNMRPALLERLGQPVWVPGLNERPSEIGQVLCYFAGSALQKRRDLRRAGFIAEQIPDSQRLALGPDEVPQDLIEDLAHSIAQRLTEFAIGHHWPGNFRSLRVVVEFAICLGDVRGGEEHYVADVCERFRRRARAVRERPAPDTRRVSSTPMPPLDDVVEEDEPMDDEETVTVPPSMESNSTYQGLVTTMRTACPRVRRSEHERLCEFLVNQGDTAFPRSDLDMVLQASAGTSRNRLRVLQDQGWIERTQGDLYRLLQQSAAVPQVTVSPERAALSAFEFRAPHVTLDQRRASVLGDVLGTLDRTCRGVYLGGGPNSGKTTVARAVATEQANVRHVLWWSCVQQDFEQFFEALEEYVVQRGWETRESISFGEDRSLRDRAMALTGHMHRFAGDDAPLLILDGEEQIRTLDARAALLVILSRWTCFRLLVVGPRMDGYLNVGAALELVETTL